MSTVNDRVESLRQRLQSRLEDEVKDDPMYRVLWLVRHLEQYLERWVSFAKIESIGVRSTLSNETFYVVLAAILVITDRIACLDRAKPFPRVEWKQFCNALERVQMAPDRSELELIIQTFETFCENLPDEYRAIDL